jgi:hypothetical protein
MLKILGCDRRTTPMSRCAESVLRLSGSSRKSPPAGLDWFGAAIPSGVGPGFVRGASGFVTERLARV